VRLRTHTGSEWSTANGGRRASFTRSVTKTGTSGEGRHEVTMSALVDIRCDDRGMVTTKYRRRRSDRLRRVLGIQCKVGDAVRLEAERAISCNEDT
jgi:hypothetical protein